MKVVVVAGVVVGIGDVGLEVVDVEDVVVIVGRGSGIGEIISKDGDIRQQK